MEINLDVFGRTPVPYSTSKEKEWRKFIFFKAQEKNQKMVGLREFLKQLVS